MDDRQQTLDEREPPPDRPWSMVNGQRSPRHYRHPRLRLADRSTDRPAVRELHVYCELIPWNAPAERFAELNPQGYILSGGPASVYEPGAPALPPFVLASGKPVLGICYGMQLLACRLGGQVDPAARREYGLAQIELTDIANPALRQPQAAGYQLPASVWMSHGDHVTDLPSDVCTRSRPRPRPSAAMGDVNAASTACSSILKCSIHHRAGISCATSAWISAAAGLIGRRPTSSTRSVASAPAQVGEARVICGLSGGVDSAVAAALVQRAIGDRLTLRLRRSWLAAPGRG